MTDAGTLCNAAPVAPAFLKIGSNYGVQIGVHAHSIAKFCAVGKQHFAHLLPQSNAMEQRPLNQVLADRLTAAMEARGLSNNRLGKLAGVAPNTIANYKRRDKDSFTTKGKDQSAKLLEIERIATALGIFPLDLLSDKPGPDTSPQAQALAVLFEQITNDSEQKLFFAVAGYYARMAIRGELCATLAAAQRAWPAAEPSHALLVGDALRSDSAQPTQTALLAAPTLPQSRGRASPKP
jgi:transcriptional regulator with XRE-family HTH domain